MSHQDSGWRPKGGAETFRGYDVWDHGIFPNEVNSGKCEGEVSIDCDDDHDH